VAPVYEKDDFFDTMSCEALERLGLGSKRENGDDGGENGAGAEDKPVMRYAKTFSEQRKIDMET
jgi:hypothetical protein